MSVAGDVFAATIIAISATVIFAAPGEPVTSLPFSSEFTHTTHPIPHNNTNARDITLRARLLAHTTFNALLLLPSNSLSDGLRQAIFTNRGPTRAHSAVLIALGVRAVMLCRDQICWCLLNCFESCKRANSRVELSELDHRLERDWFVLPPYA